MLNEHKQTMREALEMRRLFLVAAIFKVDLDDEAAKQSIVDGLKAIDAALAALDEPPLPADVREAIAYIIDDYLDDSYYYDVEDSERAQKLVGIVRAWLDALPQEPTP